MKTPFTLDVDFIYTCSAHRTISELIGAGVDVYATVYQAVGLEKTVYEAARRVDMVIVTLMTMGAETVQVPMDYVLGYDNSSFVDHQWVIVTASMGLLPVDYDTTRIRAAVTDAISAYTGIQTEAHIVVKTLDKKVTEAEARANEQTREQYITYRSTLLKDKAELAQLAEQLREENARLIAWIEELQTTPPPPDDG